MEKTIKVNKIVESYVDGPGRRTVVFMQGCPIRCEGCQNRDLWDPEGGELYDVEQLADRLAFLAREHGNITISGGEPFAQAYALSQLVISLRKKGVKHIIVYTGYVWEQLQPTSLFTSKWLWFSLTIDHIDVLVDGQFVKSLDDHFLTYRGSRNQRPIDVKKSLKMKRVVTLDWDNPEIVLTAEGNALMPIGMARSMQGVGQSCDTRMCGQTK